MTPADAGAVLGSKCRTARLAAQLVCMSMCKGDKDMEGCEAKCIKETRPAGGYAVSVEVCNKDTHGAAAATTATVATTADKTSGDTAAAGVAATAGKASGKASAKPAAEAEVVEEAEADPASEEEENDEQEAGMFST